MRVLVTRPEEDARRLAGMLAGQGIGVVCAPLLDIVYTADDALDLDGAQAVLLTSANGVRALAARTARRDLPALCVGDATAREARDAGFRDVRSAEGDVDDLARLVLRDLRPDGGALVHPAGSRVAGDLGGALARAGFAYRRAVLYAAHKAESLPAQARDALVDGGLDGVLLYSPRTAQAFVRLVTDAGLTDRLGGVTAYCLSDAVARALDGLNWAAVRVADRPEQDALLALLLKDA